MHLSENYSDLNLVLSEYFCILLWTTNESCLFLVRKMKSIYFDESLFLSSCFLLGGGEAKTQTHWLTLMWIEIQFPVYQFGICSLIINFNFLLTYSSKIATEFSK